MFTADQTKPDQWLSLHKLHVNLEAAYKQCLLIQTNKIPFPSVYGGGGDYNIKINKDNLFLKKKVLKNKQTLQTILQRNKSWQSIFTSFQQIQQLAIILLNIDKQRVSLALN